MRYLRQSNNQRVILPADSAIGAGGEARVYAIPADANFAAKIYHRPTRVQARKLAVMVANPPDDPMRAQGHISIAWPIDLLRLMYGTGEFGGFLMPRVSHMRALFHIYNPVTRRQEWPLFNYLYLHRAARNICSAVGALHAGGYVIGDINESNILVAETALVTFVDTDSFQVRDPDSGQIFRCPVGKPEFTPPELQNKNFRSNDRSAYSDRFGLAVLLFQMLMEGAHPFSGIYRGEDDPPPYETRILDGHFTYGTKSVPYRPMPLAPAFELLHPALRALFVRCFEDGHHVPERRPDPQAWSAALLEAEQALVTCDFNAQHRYGEHLSACPWCARKALLGGRDPFPLEAEKPFVRTGRDIRRVERPIRAAGPATAPGTTAVPAPNALSATVGGSAAHSIQPPANLPNWPLAPSVLPSGNAPAMTSAATWVFGPSAYPLATWVAACSTVLAVLLPGFHLVFGVLSVLLGVAGWRVARLGRWMAGLSAGTGALVAVVILIGAAQRSFIVADLRTLEEKGPIRSVAFSRDSRTVATATERNEDQRLISGEVALFDARTGDLQRTVIYPGDVASVAFSPDGNSLAAGSGALMEPGTVRIWGLKPWRVRRELTGFHSDVESVAFSPDSERIVTGSRDQTVQIWDVRTGSLLRILMGPGEVFAVAISPDGRTIAAGSGSSGTGLPGRVSAWDANTGTLLWTHTAHSERCLSVAFAPDGKMLASAGNDNTLRLWQPRTGQLQRTLETPGVLMVCGVAISSDSKTLACGGSDGAARIWNLEAGAIVRVFAGQEATVQTVAFSPDNRLLACGNRSGSVNLFRLR